MHVSPKETMTTPAASRAPVGSPNAGPDGGMADAEDSKSSARKGMRVRVPLRARCYVSRHQRPMSQDIV